MWNILQGYLEFKLWCFQQNFVCLDNLTVTLLCLLVSLLCHCYLAPCPFYSVGLFDIKTLFSDWSFISKHKHKHSPYNTYFSISFLIRVHCKISEWILSTLYCAASPVNCQLYYFLLKVFFVFIFTPHEICTCEVKGTRQWRLFYGELSCVDVLVNITIVAVKCLIKKEQPW